MTNFRTSMTDDELRRWINDPRLDIEVRRQLMIVLSTRVNARQGLTTTVLIPRRSAR